MLKEDLGSNQDKHECNWNHKHKSIATAEKDHLAQKMIQVLDGIRVDVCDRGVKRSKEDLRVLGVKLLSLIKSNLCILL